MTRTEAHPQTTEQIESPTKMGKFTQKKLAQARQSVHNPEIRARRVRRRKIFHKRPYPGEAQRKPFSTTTPSVTVDKEGVIYIKRTQKGKIKSDSVILGPTQPGRDYAKRPTQKAPIQQVTARFPHGLEPFLRTAEKIRDKYQPDAKPNNEAAQMQAVAQRLLELEAIIEDFNQLTNEQVEQVLKDNLALLNRTKILKPQNEEKRIIAKMLSRGLTDIRGRKNALASTMRLYSLTSAFLERSEIGIPTILVKYGKIAAITMLKRSRTRTMITGGVRNLEISLRHPSYEAQTFENQPRENWYPWARVAYAELRPIFETLLEYAKERPYITAVRYATEIFGTYGRIRLPEGTAARKMQLKNQERANAKGEEVPTVTKHLSRGEFTEAAKLIRKIIHVLQKTLEVNANYKTIKLSRECPTKRLSRYMTSRKGLPPEQLDSFLNTLRQKVEKHTVT